MGKFERKEKSQPKHKAPASSGASKAPRPPPVQQPGWKGPTYLHKKPARPKPSPSSNSAAGGGGGSDAGGGPKLQLQTLPTELQQLVLDIFRETFPASWDFEGLKPMLQEVNAALVEREFCVAFGTEVFREAYAIRWSPSRTLCYANLLADVLSSVACEEASVSNFFLGAVESGSRSSRVVCIGGSVSELVAFGVLLRHLKPQTAGKPSQGMAEHIGGQASQRLPATATDSQDGAPPLHLTLVDTADWASVVHKLERGLKTPPALSKYASATARANNASLIDSEAMRVECIRTDVHTSGVEDLKTLLGSDAVLITLFFTLNDLYTASIPQTTKFLVQLSIAAPRGSLLLVVDRIGACSEAGVSKLTRTADVKEGGKKYHMAWLMDHLLLDKGKTKNEDDEEAESNEPLWEKLFGDEGRLFRLDESLEYPASLENTRFQVHLFRRL